MFFAASALGDHHEAAIEKRIPTACWALGVVSSPANSPASVITETGVTPACVILRRAASSVRSLIPPHASTATWTL
jgi:hypothetical protein